jgi:hypothetical protein
MPFPGNHLSPPPPNSALVPKYLKETKRKVVLIWFPSGWGSPGNWTESWWPAELPFSDEKLLVGVFWVQVVGPPLWALRSRRQPPPAASRAPRLHCVICGFAHRHPPRPESPSRRAGQTMELGAGPAGAARPFLGTRRSAGVCGTQAGRRSGELTHLKVKSPSLNFDLQILSSPRPPPESSPCWSCPFSTTSHQPRATTLKHTALEGWVGGSCLMPTRFIPFFFFFRKALSLPSLELLAALFTHSSPHPFSPQCSTLSNK